LCVIEERIFAGKWATCVSVLCLCVRGFLQKVSGKAELECHFYFVVQNENVGSGRARSIHILGAGKVAGMRL